MKKFVFIFSALMFVASTLMVITYANNQGEEEDNYPPINNVGNSTTTSSTTNTTTTTIAEDLTTTTTKTTTKSVPIVTVRPATTRTTTKTTTKATTTTAKKYDVIFNTNGGNTITKQTIESGKKATKPSDPTRNNYKFDGWYEDSALTKAFNFITAINKTYTLYAKWTQIEDLSVSRTYSTTSAVLPSNGVTVTITCNNCTDGKELKALTGWALSTNKKELTKKFTANYDDYMTINDSENKSAEIRVRINNIYDNKTSLNSSIKFVDMTDVKDNGTLVTGNVAKGTTHILLEIKPSIALDNTFLQGFSVTYNNTEMKINDTINGTPIVKIPISISTTQYSKNIKLKINWGNGYVEEYNRTVSVTFK